MRIGLSAVSPELPAAFSILSAISPFHPSPAGAACVMKGVAAIITKNNPASKRRVARERSSVVFIRIND